MKVNTDHSFAIGRKHTNNGKPCQDHALSGITEDSRAFAVVSDGCSIAGNHTDVGARIITFQTRRYAREFARIDREFWSDNVFTSRIIAAGADLMLRRDDLYATQLYAIVERDRAWARLLGDGVIVLGYEDGKRMIERYDWIGERPYYPAYGMLPQEFVDKHGGMDVEALKLTRVFMMPDGSVINQDTMDDAFAFTVGAGIKGITIPFNTDQLSYVALFSDGVCKIDQVDWLDAVCSLTSFKGWAGEFVKRRMGRYLKDLQKQGRAPLDDLSCAAIHIEHDETDIVGTNAAIE